jgi:ribosomal-protein-alanine N-acetyltransferase
VTLAELDLELRTARLVLRPIAETDAPRLYPHARDPETSRWMSWQPHADPSVTLAYVRAEARALADNTGIVWVIELAGAAAGVIGLRTLRRQQGAWRVDRAELGYWLGAPFWNQGIASEAAGEVVRFAFATLQLHKLTSGCLADNAASGRVIEKLGFRRVGVNAADAFVAGAWRDYVRYELLR